MQRPPVGAAGETASAPCGGYFCISVAKSRLDVVAADLRCVSVGDCVTLWTPVTASSGAVEPDVERGTELRVRVALSYFRCIGGAFDGLFNGAQLEVARLCPCWFSSDAGLGVSGRRGSDGF